MLLVSMDKTANRFVDTQTMDIIVNSSVAVQL